MNLYEQVKDKKKNPEYIIVYSNHSDGNHIVEDDYLISYRKKCKKRGNLWLKLAKGATAEGAEFLEDIETEAVGKQEAKLPEGVELWLDEWLGYYDGKQFETEEQIVEYIKMQYDADQ